MPCCTNPATIGITKVYFEDPADGTRSAGLATTFQRYQAPRRHHATVEAAYISGVERRWISVGEMIASP